MNGSVNASVSAYPTLARGYAANVHSRAKVALFTVL